MGDMVDSFRFMKEERLKERQKVEPNRFEYATDKLMEAGHTVGKNPKDEKSLIINGYIKFWPYTGWYSGKGIGSGRGIHKLIANLKDTSEVNNG